jgi:hypothetical protein
MSCRRTEYVGGKIIILVTIDCSQLQTLTGLQAAGCSRPVPHQARLASGDKQRRHATAGTLQPALYREGAAELEAQIAPCKESHWRASFTGIRSSMSLRARDPAQLAAIQLIVLVRLHENKAEYSFHECGVCALADRKPVE